MEDSNWDEDEEVVEAAAMWLTRLQDVGVAGTEAEKQALLRAHREWLERCPAHAAGFARMMLLWEMLGIAQSHYCRDTEPSTGQPGSPKSRNDVP